MSWAYVENYEVKEFGKLPENWRNISNFYALESNKQYLQQLGWYELIDQTIPISNDLYEYHGAAQYTIDNAVGVVYKNCPIIQKENPPTPETIFAESRKNFLDSLRNTRNELLSQCDWTQLTDIQSVKSNEWIESWKQYRQSLRDMPQQYQMPPLDQIIDINQIIWPSLPEQ